MVDFSIYMDDLADQIGAKPKLWPLLRDSRLLLKLHAGPFCGSHFRLFGPHAKPKMARRVLMHARSPTHVFRFLDFGLAELARILRLKKYQSRLSIIGPIRTVRRGTGRKPGRNHSNSENKPQDLSLSGT